MMRLTRARAGISESMHVDAAARLRSADGDDIIVIIIIIISWIQSIAELIRDSNAASVHVCMALNGLILSVLRCVVFGALTYVCPATAAQLRFRSVDSGTITATFDWFLRALRYSQACERCSQLAD